MGSDTKVDLHCESRERERAKVQERKEELGGGEFELEEMLRAFRGF